MKVAVLNYSGSVGKTVVASHLLAPRIPGAEIIAVESINETAADLGLEEVEVLRAQHFGRLFRSLLMAEAVVIDVGASNVEEFLGELVKYDEAHGEIDFYVLPVIATGKAQRETLKTIQALSAIGVPEGKIRVLFNRVDADVQDEFAAVFGYERSVGGFFANPAAAIPQSEIFDLLSNRRTTIQAVVADPTDFREQLRGVDRKDTAAIARLSDAYATQAMAKPIQRKLDAVFEALFI